MRFALIRPSGTFSPKEKEFTVLDKRMPSPGRSLHNRNFTRIAGFHPWWRMLFM